MICRLFFPEVGFLPLNQEVKTSEDMTLRAVPDRQSNAEDLSNLKILTRSTIHQLIANGHQIVIANTRVLQLDRWLTRHPGGEKTILHMVGRDATDEINGYTPAFRDVVNCRYHSEQALRMMK